MHDLLSKQQEKNILWESESDKSANIVIEGSQGRSHLEMIYVSKQPVVAGAIMSQVILVVVWSSSSENVQIVILNKTYNNYWQSPVTIMPSLGGVGVIFMVFRQKIMAFIIHCNCWHQNIFNIIFLKFALEKWIRRRWELFLCCGPCVFM